MAAPFSWLSIRRHSLSTTTSPAIQSPRAMWKLHLRYYCLSHSILRWRSYVNPRKEGFNSSFNWRYRQLNIRKRLLADRNMIRRPWKFRSVEWVVKEHPNQNDSGHIEVGKNCTCQGSMSDIHRSKIHTGNSTHSSGTIRRSVEKRLNIKLPRLPCSREGLL